MPTATTDATSVLGTPFALAGGATIKNRLVKAAMSEQLANVTGAPTEALEALYARWARGGAGMLITGNVIIDRRSITALGAPCCPRCAATASTHCAGDAARPGRP